MIHITALQLEIALGRFHRVVSISANQKFLSVQNSLDVEFLVPIYPPPKARIQIIHPHPYPTPPPAQSVVHLDHLELHDVTLVDIQPHSLTIATLQGVRFKWKVHPHVPA